MRYNGIIMPIFSLPTEYGIGTMGHEARDFVDFLVSAGSSIWEIPAINHTDLTGTPANAISAFAGNPLLIDLGQLVERGWLSKKLLQKADWGKDRAKVNYRKLHSAKLDALFAAYTAGFSSSIGEFTDFCAKNSIWLEDYAVFVAIKEHFDWRPFAQWGDYNLEIHSHKSVESFRQALAVRVEFFKYVQFLFYQQWNDLRAYAKARGVKILGGITYSLHTDCAEKWANPAIDAIEHSCEEQFRKWWDIRLDWCKKNYDITKIAANVRDEELFVFFPNSFEGDGQGLYKYLCAMGNPVDDNIFEIAHHTHSFQRAFFGSARKRNMPHFYEKNSIAYLGTCCDDTIRGWTKTLPKEEQADFSEYIGSVLPRDQAWCALHTVWQSSAGIVLAPLQDFLELGGAARLCGHENPANNWTWRLRKGSLTNRLAQRIAKMNRLFDRI